MTPRLLFTLSVIASVTVCALFLAFEFQANASVPSAIGVSALILALGAIAADALAGLRDKRIKGQRRLAIHSVTLAFRDEALRAYPSDITRRP